MLRVVQRPSPCDTLGFLPPSDSQLFSKSTFHTSSGLSSSQGSTWFHPALLGAFIWFQYLNYPPTVCISFKIINFLNSLGFNTYTFPIASPQLLAFILFLFFLNLPPVPLSNFLHSFDFISGSPVASPQFLAYILFRYPSISKSFPGFSSSQKLLECVFILVQYLCVHPV